MLETPLYKPTFGVFGDLRDFAKAPTSWDKYSYKTKTGRYKFKDELQEAKANAGVVCLYVDTWLNRLCAVKKIPIWFVNNTTEWGGNEQPWMDQGVVRYLLKQGVDYVPQWYDCCRDGDHVYFVSEFVPGGDLFDRVDVKRTTTPLGESAAKGFMFQVIEIVRDLHNRGIVHFDLSLENVLVDVDGRCRVIDFGQAKMLVPTGKDKLNTPKHPAFESFKNPRGKPSCQAPEMHHGPYQGIPADIFSLGCMVLQLMTTLTFGKHPWDGAPHSSRMVGDVAVQYECENFRHFETNGLRAHLAGLEKKSGKSVQFSTELLHLLERMVNLDPTKRPTAQECLEHAAFDETRSTVHTPRMRGPVQPYASDLTLSGGCVQGGVSGGLSGVSQSTFSG